MAAASEATELRVPSPQSPAMVVDQTAPLFDNIPRALQDIPHWTFEKDKVPCDRKGNSTGWNNPEKWYEFADVREYWEKHRSRLQCHGIDGIGFILGRDDSQGDRQIIVIDLDECRDPVSGWISSWALKLLKKLNSYTEISKSGTGFHVVFYGKLPWDIRQTEGMPPETLPPETWTRIKEIKPRATVCNKLEMFENNKNVVITGKCFDEFPADLEYRQKVLVEIIADENLCGEGFQQCADAQGATRSKADDSKVVLDRGFKEFNPRLPAVDLRKIIDTSEMRFEGGEYVGSHPVKGSTTGKNFRINLDKGPRLPDGRHAGVWSYWHDYSGSGDPPGGDFWDWCSCDCGAVDWMKAGSGNLADAAIMERTKRYAVKLAKKYGFEDIVDNGTMGFGPEDSHPEIITEEELAAIPAAENPRLEVLLEPDNVIMQYIQYGKSTCDAYVEYHYAMAISLVSIATNRNVVLNLAQGEVYPNIWAFILGESTISRKSAAIAKGQSLAENLFPFTALPQSYSPEGLIEELSEKPRGYLYKDEAGAMLASMAKNYMLEMRDLYCEIYDCKGFRRKLRSGQRKKKADFEVKDPYMNIVTATTPESFRAYTSLLDLTSGWLLRFIYFYPNYRKEWMAFKEISEENKGLRSKAFTKLNAIANSFSDREEPLEIKLSPEAWKYYQDWQERREMILQNKSSAIEKAILADWNSMFSSLPCSSQLAGPIIMRICR